LLFKIENNNDLGRRIRATDSGWTTMMGGSTRMPIKVSNALRVFLLLCLQSRESWFHAVVLWILWISQTFLA